MVIEVILTVIVAVFAVFGVYCALRLIASSCFLPHYPATVTAMPDEPTDEIIEKVRSAKSGDICGKCGVLVLVYGENKPLLRLLEDKKIEYITVAEEKGD